MKRQIILVPLMATLLIGGMTGSAPKPAKQTEQPVTHSEHIPVLSLSAAKVCTVIPNLDAFVPYSVPLSEDLQKFLFSECGEDEKLFALALALIDVESGFQPDMVSSTDDYGLMQINKINHGWLSDELGITDFINPYDNIRAGMHMLRVTYKAQDGDISRTLMVYNLGQRGAERLWKQGVTSTHYTQKVLTRLQELKEDENEKGEL